MMCDNNVQIVGTKTDPNLTFVVNKPYGTIAKLNDCEELHSLVFTVDLFYKKVLSGMMLCTFKPALLNIIERVGYGNHGDWTEEECKEVWGE